MSSVFLSNVDDYLAPSQACINPLFSEDANKNSDEPGKDDDQPSNQIPSNAVVTTTTRRRRVGRRRGRGRDRSQQLTNNNSVTTNNNATKMSTSRDNDSSMDIIMTPTPNQMETFSDNNNNPMVPPITTTSPEQQQQFPLSTTTTTTMATTSTTVSQPTQKKTEFSMADCLACSGCVTTAETVLVEQHSLSSLQSKCKEAHTTNTKICFTISPSSLSDILRHLQIATTTASNNNLYSVWARRLTTFLYQTCHASLVVDGNLPLQWSLLEAAYEFCYTYKQQQQQQQQQQIITQSQEKNNNDHNNDDAMDIEDDSHEKMERKQLQQQPSVALSCRQSQIYTGNGETQIITHPPGRRQQPPKEVAKLPLIASSCPALVCLIEKSTPPAVPHLSSVKSPMAMTGTVLKKYYASSSQQHHHQITEQEPPTTKNSANTHTNSNNNILHIAIMPCHDKKLEASRKDLQYYESIPDTDLVITTQELLTLITETIITNNNNNNNNNNNSTTPSIGKCGSVSVHDMQTYLQSLPLSHMESSLQDELLLYHSNDDRNENCNNNSKDRGGAILVSQLWNCSNDSNESMGDANNNNAATPTTMMVDNNTTTTTMKMLDEDATRETATLTTATAPNTSPTTTIPLSSWLSGSGGYADFIFKFAAQHLFGYHVVGHVPWKPVLSGSQRRRRQVKSARLVEAQQKQKSDMHEAILYRHTNGTYSCSKEDGGDDSSSIPVLRFATAYGLQNIQRIIQPFKSQSSSSMSLNDNASQQQVVDSSSSPSPYHYIEAMACPSGCINGGGQIVMPPTSSNGAVGGGELQHAVTGNTRETPTQTRQRLLETQTVFHDIHNNNRNKDDGVGNSDFTGYGISTMAYDIVYNDSTCPSGPFGSESHELLHTRFHIVPAMQSSNTGVPTVRDTQW